jgi:demethylmenaquinone methyltransferase/2-methoxy-6-polyprenyl-1,4-benzoquinol methylase
MRWLERAPSRYDAGMRLLTLGRAARCQDALARVAVEKPAARILEIGCGTGALTVRLVARGATVLAVDQNPAMLEQARARLAAEPPERAARVEWVERSAAEIDGLPAAGFDAVVASFAFSEMSAGERAFVLRAVRERLRAGGRLLIVDEVRPRGAPLRAVHALLRAPQALLGWLLAGSVSRPIPDLAGEIAAAGLRVESETRWLGDGLALVVARA